MIEQHSLLMTLKQVSELLQRSKDGIRLSLRETTPYAVQLNSAKVRIGRRIYFRTPEIARLLLGIEPNA